MSGGGNGKLDANAQALADITNGIRNSMSELSDVGGIAEASTGRGFGELSLSGLETGHDGLASSFSHFCDRWEWGVRALMRDANDFAKKVGLSAGAYYETDHYISNTLKVGANALMGNPHLSEEQVEHQTWKQTLSDNGFNDALHPDFSAKSFEDAAHHAGQTWTQTGKDLMDSAKTGGPTPFGMAYRTARSLEEK
ncbi:hypothetical protein [Streptomyces orinoci]|uniref:Uncharacterized protein n=1 Tax=Streptomyces orinoci TaxID=67339 RepID=A0ABV3JTX3_STRON|nr:hypothetical protein [Streptomyces orinoci]